MLELISISKPDEKRKYLENFDSRRQTWLVSDLRSKFEIQNQLFQRLEVLPEDSVLRASELWRKLALKAQPDLHLISKDLCLTLFSHWLKEETEPWLQAPGVAKSLFQHIQQLLPLYIHSESRSLMPEWFEKNAESARRWESWWELGLRFLGRLIADRLYPSQWAQALFVHSEDFSEMWSREIIVDLNVEITPVEAEIFLQISKQAPVKVLVPSPEWMGYFSNLNRGYSHLYEKQGLKSSVPSQFVFPKSGKTLRMPTQLAEVKQAVAQVRKLLDQGVAPRSIALAAAEVEMYWPVLRLYLQEEGIPFNKDSVVPLQSFLPMQRWMSRLRLALSKVETEDLETHLFSSISPVISYDRFRELYTHIFGSEDLAREEKIEAIYQSEIKPTQPITRDEFIHWTLKYLDSSMEIGWLDSIFPPWLQEVPFHFRLPGSDWLLLLEGRVARKEVLKERGKLEGIQIVNLPSVEWLSVHHLILLGVNDEFMRQHETTALTQSDIHQIYQDLGVVLNPAENHNLEFEALWLQERSLQSLTIMTADNNFSGSVLTPSLIWLLAAHQEGKIRSKAQLPEETRWDELQQLEESEISKLRNLSEERFQFLFQRVALDLGEEEESPQALPVELKLSASRLEDFAHCPFIFKAEQLFQLRDRPEMDLDVDHMKRGSLIHEVLKSLLDHENFLSLTKEQRLEIIESCRSRIQLHVADEALWPPFRERILYIIEQFLDEEKEWRQKIEILATPGRELRFQVFFDPSSKNFSSQPLPVEIRGQVDRVDALSQGQWAVLDYKSSLQSKHRNWKSWVEDPQELQLALYSYLIENGHTQLKAGEVVAGLYVGLKERNRNKGFVVGGSHADPQLSRYNKIDPAEKQELYDKLVTHLSDVGTAILNGNLKPNPENGNFAICTGCSWKEQCRAPHLN